jgi:hypothetical protein
MDLMKMEPDMLSSQWGTQLPASFTLVAVKCEVEVSWKCGTVLVKLAH